MVQFLMLMAASRKISSLGSSLKFAVEEHHQHVSPHRGPCPPPIYPETFPSESLRPLAGQGEHKGCLQGNGPGIPH